MEKYFPTWWNWYDVPSRCFLLRSAQKFYQLLNVFLQKALLLTRVSHLHDKGNYLHHCMISLYLRLKIQHFTLTDIVTDYEDALFHELSKCQSCGLYVPSWPSIIQNWNPEEWVIRFVSLKSWIQKLGRTIIVPTTTSVKYNCWYVSLPRPILSQLDEEKLAKLFQYYERYWLGKIGTLRISVFQS